MARLRVKVKDIEFELRGFGNSTDLDELILLIKELYELQSGASEKKDSERMREQLEDYSTKLIKRDKIAEVVEKWLDKYNTKNNITLKMKRELTAKLTLLTGKLEAEK